MRKPVASGPPNVNPGGRRSDNDDMFYDLGLCATIALGGWLAFEHLGHRGEGVRGHPAGSDLGRPAIGRPAVGRPAEGQQPASLDEALDVYLPLLLVERDIDAAKARLSEVIHDPELAQKIADAAPSGEEDLGFGPDSMDDEWDVMAGPGRGGRREGRRGRAGRRAPPPAGPVDHSPVAHVAGVILGSPEFQRR